MGEGPDWLELASTWMLNAAFATVSGCIASVWMLGRTSSGWSRSRSEVTVKVLTVAPAASIAFFALVLWADAAAISEQALLAAIPSLAAVVARTHIGHCWLIGTASLVILATLVPLAHEWRAPSTIVVFAGACAIVFAASRSAMSHAGASGDLLRWLVDAAHLLAVSVWSGSVLLATGVVLRQPHPIELGERFAYARYAELLSATATWSLAVVLGTGAVSAWGSLASASGNAFATPYSQALIAKLVLVAIAVGLGAFNRYRTLPPMLRDLRASEPSAMHRKTFQRVLLIESGVLLAVLGMAAVLSTSAPPSSDPTLSFTQAIP